MSTELATNPGGEAQPAAPSEEVAAPDELELETPQPEGQAEEDEEVEYEGGKYRVPKPLAKGLMLHADYTKKTQEVAELRRTTEAEKARIAEDAKAFQEDRKEHVQAYALWQQLEAYKGVNWQQLDAEDPLQAQQLFRQYTLLKDAHRDVVGQIQAKQSQRKSQADAEQATLRDQTRAALAREIPSWSPKTEQDLTSYALKHGYKAEEVTAALNSDARPFKFLHKAFLYDQLIDKQRRAADAQPQAEPVKKVASRPAVQGVHDTLPTAEWMKRRNAQR